SFLGFFRLSCAKVYLAHIKLGSHVVGGEIHGPSQHLKRAIPVAQTLIAERAFVEGIDETRVNLECSRIGNLRLRIFALFEESVALSDEFLLTNVRIPRTR